MSFNDDFMDFIGFMTDGTGEWPDDDDMSDDEDEKKGEKKEYNTLVRWHRSVNLGV